jgi:hypothetical protein
LLSRRLLILDRLRKNNPPVNSFSAFLSGWDADCWWNIWWQLQNVELNDRPGCFVNCDWFNQFLLLPEPVDRYNSPKLSDTCVVLAQL